MTHDRPTEEEVLATLQEERLTNWSWFGTGHPDADEAGIRRDGDRWLVYNTDERAAQAYQRRFDDESAALLDFLELARANTRYFAASAERMRWKAEAVLRERREQ